MQRLILQFCAGVAAALLSATGVAQAGGCEARSGTASVPLLELYTSEGCDSCPPADRWLAGLRDKGFGRDRLVALAFHVDYWNYLGWTDRFAQGLFSERQQEFGRRTNAATIYTPEFVLNGREYRRWSNRDLGRELERIVRTTPPRADIALGLNRVGAELHVHVEASLRDRAPAQLYLALYENDLRTHVRSGENRGRTLRHEAVVRRFAGPLAFDEEGKVRVRHTWPLAPDWKPGDLGVAGFVQETGGTAILQALALGLCGGEPAKKSP